MKYFNYGVLTVLVLFGFSGCGGKPMPKSYVKSLDTSISSELTDGEINSILQDKVNLKYRDNHYSVHAYSVDYNYKFGSENKTIIGKLSGGCFNGRYPQLISSCESHNFWAPDDSFLEGIENAKQYFDADKHVELLRKWNTHKKKITDCQASIKIPTATLVDGSGKLGNIVKYVKMSNVNHNKAGLFDNNRIANEASLACENLNDTFSLSLSSEHFSLNPSSYSFKYADINKESNKLPDIKLGRVSYQFFKNPYEINDKFIKAVLTPSASIWASSIYATVSIQNLTSEFLELQGISIYYRDEVYEYLGAGDSHLDLSPETTSDIIGNKLRKDLPKLVEIKSKNDTLKIGLAIKYKVKSTNQILTLYKTTQLPISELK